jgi:hypothetical protein
MLASEVKLSGCNQNSNHEGFCIFRHALTKDSCNHEWSFTDALSDRQELPAKILLANSVVTPTRYKHTEDFYGLLGLHKAL